MFTHALMTRFNVRFARSPSSSALALSDQWLSERVALFEDYCLASVLTQTEYPDVWLILLDKDTPEHIRERAASWGAAYPFIRPVFIDAFDIPVAVRVVQDNVPRNCEWLVTSRLDSDDAIHPRFFEVLRANVVEGRREFLNVPSGLIIAAGKCFRKAIKANPFISFSEPRSNPQTIWAEQHGLLGSIAPVRQMWLRDGWIQIIHGGNLSNTVRGVRVSAASVSRDCLPPRLAAQLIPDNFVDLCVDNTIGLWQRYAPAVSNVLRACTKGWR